MTMRTSFLAALHGDVEPASLPAAVCPTCGSGATTDFFAVDVLPVHVGIFYDTPVQAMQECNADALPAMRVRPQPAGRPEADPRPAGLRSRAAVFAGVTSVLWPGNRPAAIHLAMQSRHVLSSRIPAYNPDLAPFSPGLVLHVELARAAVEREIRRNDLCHGYNQLKRTLMSGAPRWRWGQSICVQWGDY